MTDHNASPASDDLPLISNRFLYRLSAVVAVLAGLTIAITVAGRWYGEKMALGGHTDSADIFSVDIGQDRLSLSANTIRMREQRRSGPAERVDIYLTWPGLEGYSEQVKGRFNATSGQGGLVFLQISQATMTRDMSGRLGPIYSLMFEGAPEQGPHGLILHRLSPDSGYGNEIIYTATREGMPDYAVRCLMPENDRASTGGDCQRDLRIGKDLSVLYRFSAVDLKDWHHIDAAISDFVETRLVGGIPDANGTKP